MKIPLIICFILLSAYAQEDDPSHIIQQPTAETVTEVGQVISGSIDPTYAQQALHTIRVRSLEQKYLFIALNSEDAAPVSIGLYSNSTRDLVHACSINSLDSCYVPRE